MRQFFLACVALVVLTLVGCNKGVSVVGTWKPDVNTLKATAKDPKIQPAIDQNISKAKDMMSKVSMTFKEDGTYSAVDPDGSTKTGKYSVSGNSVTVSPDKVDPKRKEPVATISNDGKSITVKSEVDQPPMTVELTFVKSS